MNHTPVLNPTTNGAVMKKKWFSLGLTVVTVCAALLFTVPAYCQSTADLDARLKAVEEYLEKLPPSMANYAGSLQDSINNYTKNLENGLNKYTDRLERNIETKLMGLNEKTIELDVETGAYKKIETPTGYFLIAVND